MGTELLFMEVDDNYEFSFVNFSDDKTFASDTSNLRDPNVFIADTDATSDTTQFLRCIDKF